MKEKKDDKVSTTELICVQPCDVPGVREFKVGDRISDPEFVAKFAENPYFKVATSEDKQS